MSSKGVMSEAQRLEHLWLVVKVALDVLFCSAIADQHNYSSKILSCQKEQIVLTRCIITALWM